MIQRSKRRRRSRGVAMVEAGILAPIFAMMMMMTIYLDGTYETKYRTVLLSRYATWSYASNACSNENFKPVTDDLPGAIKPGATSNSTGDSVTQQQDPNQNSNQYTNQAQGGAQAGASMFMGHGTSTLTFDYAPTYRFNSGPKQITTESQTVCNTPPPQGMNIFSYLGNILGKVL
jgi:hypothetical protein